MLTLTDPDLKPLRERTEEWYAPDRPPTVVPDAYEGLHFVHVAPRAAPAPRPKPSHEPRKKRTSPDRPPAVVPGTDQGARYAAIGVASLATLAIGLLGAVTGVEALRLFGFGLYLVLGVGAATLWFLPRMTASESIVVSAALGAASLCIAGTAMVDGRAWHPTALAACLFVVSAGSHVYAMLTRGQALLRVDSLRWLGWHQDERTENPWWLRLDGAPWQPGLGFRQRTKARRLVAPSFAWTRDPTWYLLAAGVVLCAVGVGTVANSDPSGGTLGALPALWYEGLALLALVLVARPRNKPTVIAAVVAMTVVLTGSGSVLYTLPRLPWAAKQVGFVSFISAHGSLNGLTGFYRAFPGFYAAASVMCHVLGIHDPMSLARWWTPGIDLASMFAVHALARRFTTSDVRAWFAAMLFVLGNTIQQDYFSPQSLGFFLALAVLVVAFVMWRSGLRERFILGCLLILVSIGLTVSHPISPILVTAALVMLVFFGRLRPRFIFLVAIVPFLVWDALHFSVTHWFSANHVGNANNFSPPTVGTRSEHEMIVAVVAILGAAALAYIGLAALLSAYKIRDRQMLTLLACAASAFGLGVGTSYGSEALFRIELFALPWLAIAAACLPLPRQIHLRQKRSICVAMLLLPLIGTFLVAQYGLDAVYAIQPQTLRAEQLFETTAPPGAILVAADSGPAPFRSTARYPLYGFESESQLLYVDNVGRTESATEVAQTLGSNLRRIFWTRPAVYFLFSPESKSYTTMWGLQSAATQTQFETSLLDSPDWQIVSSDRGAILLRLANVMYNQPRAHRVAPARLKS